MSTSAVIHFKWASGEDGAVIFRQCDGAPDQLGLDLLRFFEAVEEQAPHDTRFGDPCYLAARWVVFDAEAHRWQYGNGPLAFLSVGVVLPGQWGGAWRYDVTCHGRFSPEGNAERPDVDAYETIDN